MKKFLVVLMILAIAGGVFAQDITFGGQVEAGILFEKADNDADLTALPYNDDAEVGLRVDLNAAAEWENVGAKFKIRNDDGAFALGYGFVWANVLNDIIKINAGLLDDAAWATEGDFDSNYDNVSGVRVEVKPIDGRFLPGNRYRRQVFGRPLLRWACSEA